MRFSAINFPWVGRNPFRLAGTMWMFVCALSLPMAGLVLFFRHQYWLALIPLLFATLMAIVFLSVSLAIGSLMRRLDRRQIQPKDGAEFYSICMVVKGILKTPGIAVVKESRLVLTPLFGKPVDFPLSQILVASEKRMFNGKLLFGKAKGFWLAVPGRWRLGVAVEDGNAFRSILEHHAVRVD